MRALSALIFLAVCALLVIAYQAIQQELNIRNLKTRIAVSTEQVKFKEAGIVAAKMKVEEMNKKITPVNTQKDQLKKQKEEYKKAFPLLEKDLSTCKSDKNKLDKQRTDANEAIEQAKVTHEEERRKAEEEIEDLKQNILNRDVKICEFVDLKVEEARMLCSGVRP